jgi:type IV secretory pathway VirB2 component (pilin)
MNRLSLLHRRLGFRRALGFVIVAAGLFVSASDFAQVLHQVIR